MLMQLIAPPRPIRDSKRPRTLHHKSNRILRDAHLRRLVLARSLELLVRDTMGHEPALKRDATGLKLVRAASVLAVDQTHELGCGIAVVVGRTVRVARYVPPWRENKEISEWSCRISRWGGKHAEDGWIDVVDGDGADVDELGEVVLVWDVVTVPSHDVKGRVVLNALEELAAEFVDDLPWLLLDFIFGDWVQEVASVGETVGSERP
jgi:hypothetical protein